MGRVLKKVIHTSVTGGKFEHQEQIDNAAKAFEAKRCTVTIDNEKKRSTEQNAYIHAVVFPLIRDLFNDHSREGIKALKIDDAKDWVQSEGYWGYKMVGKKTIAKRSSEATTAEMVNGIEKLQMDFANWGLIIPDPDQTEFLEDKNGW